MVSCQAEKWRTFGCEGVFQSWVTFYHANEVFKRGCYFFLGLSVLQRKKRQYRLIQFNLFNDILIHLNIRLNFRFLIRFNLTICLTRQNKVPFIYLQTTCCITGNRRSVTEEPFEVMSYGAEYSETQWLFPLRATGVS